MLERHDDQLIICSEVETAFSALFAHFFTSQKIKQNDDIYPYLLAVVPDLRAIINELDQSGSVAVYTSNEETALEITLHPLNAQKILLELEDRTNVRALQRQLHVKQETLELIDQAHPGALFEVKRDHENRISMSFVSPRLAEVMQLENLEVDQFLQNIDADIRKKIFDGLKSCTKTKEFIIEGVLHLPQKRYWLMRASVLTSSNDSTILLGVLENTTEKTLQLEQIKYTSVFLSTITQNVPVGIAVSHIPDKRYLYVNNQLCRITGFSEEEFLSKGLALTRDYILADDKDGFFTNLDNARAFYHQDNADKNHAFSAQIRITTKEKQERYINVSFRPLGDKSEHGTYDTFIHLSQDVTSQVLSERQKRKDEILMIQSNKMAELGEMASCLAHEINNPLSIMTHLLENIETRYKDEEIQLAFQVLERMSKIIKALTGFARDAGDSPPGEKAIPLRQIISDTLLLCENRLTNRRIRFETQGDLNVAPYINDTLLSQVLLNLINNSVDALEKSEGPKWLKINVQVHKNALNINFSDAGKAPDISIMQQWFEPFYTSKPKGHGTGLGLSICQNLLRSAGGIIRPMIRDNTTFQISLPLWPSGPHKL